jgi:MFS family permease
VQAWSAVTIIFMASVVAAIDRGIFSLVIDPIRHDLRISDVQISLLQGLSFSILYAVAGIALGFGIDRYSRRRLLALGILIWSLATALGGLATNFNEMFATRIMVGFGEAVLGPCTASMIADLFAPGRRGRPVSFCLMGLTAGRGLTVLLTGFILSRLPDGIPVSVPGFGILAPWRVTFLVCGAIGFLIFLLILTMREPARRDLRLKGSTGLSMRASFAYFRSRRRVFAPLYLGFAVVSAGYYGITAWDAVFLIRKFGLSAPATGQALGMATLLAGLAGAFVAGNLVDVFSRGQGAVGKLKLLVWTPFIALPGALAVLATTPTLAIIMISITLASFPIYSTAVLTLIQDLTPNEMRGVGASITGLVNTIIGTAGGPLLIALATEHLYGAPKLVGWSMMTVSIPAALLGSLLALHTLRNFRQSTQFGDTAPKAT